MKRTLAIALLLGLAACGDKGKLEAVTETAPPQPITKPAAVPAEPAKAEPDRELEQRVSKAMLAGKLHNVGVEALGGFVTLRGSAPSRREIDRAVQLAAKVDGVKSVDSKLEVVTGS